MGLSRLTLASLGQAAGLADGEPAGALLHLFLRADGPSESVAAPALLLFAEGLPAPPGQPELLAEGAPVQRPASAHGRTSGLIEGLLPHAFLVAEAPTKI